MNDEFDEIANKLSDLGWILQILQEPAKLPLASAERFSWLPIEVITFLTRFESVVAPSQKAWLITCSELSGESDSAFTWNQWEVDSLSAASDDPDWQTSIRSFWDEHFPVLLSVKSGYAYAAIRRDLTIVAGEEPEFEEAVKIADDFLHFLRLLTDRGSDLYRWI